MTAIAALLRSDTRPALLVSSERTVIDFNRALGQALGFVEKGGDLALYCLDRTDAIDAYLRRCAATRDPLPGAISVLAAPRRILIVEDEISSSSTSSANSPRQVSRSSGLPTTLRMPCALPSKSNPMPF